MLFRQLFEAEALINSCLLGCEHTKRAFLIDSVVSELVTQIGRPVHKTDHALVSAN